MRSMTFDMVGMTLMALGVILTCGVMLMWGYVRSTRGPRRNDDVPTGEATPQLPADDGSATDVVAGRR